MSRIYSSLEAAAEIGTTPRLLRRFIRQNESWKNATYAGRYSFTEAELKSLDMQFKKWASTKSRSTPRPPSEEEQELLYLDEDKGITVEEMHLAAKDPYRRRQVLANRLERQRKLEARIAETRIRNNFTPQDA